QLLVFNESVNYISCHSCNSREYQVDNSNDYGREINYLSLRDCGTRLRKSRSRKQNHAKQQKSCYCHRFEPEHLQSPYLIQAWTESGTSLFMQAVRWQGAGAVFRWRLAKTVGVLPAGGGHNSAGEGADLALDS